MTNKELGKAIRELLKTNGYNIKGISVRVKAALYDTSVNITVKDLTISTSDIDKLVSGKFEKIDYCERSMEILSGGNTYVSVRYDHEVVAVAREAKMEEAQQLWDQAQSTCKRNTGMTVARDEKNGTHATLMLGNHDGENCLVIFVDGKSCSCNERGKWAAYNVYALAEGLVFYELHGRFR